MSPDPAAFIHALGLPAAWVDASGCIACSNEAFTAWAPDCADARLDTRADGAWLLSAGRTPLRVRAERLGTGFLLLPPSEGGHPARDAVVTHVARRLERVATSLEAALGAVLREHPPAPLAASIREALAGVEGLHTMRREVLALSDSSAGPEAMAVNLGTLAQDALTSMGGPLPVDLGVIDTDCVVRAIPEKGFWAIATLAGTLARSIGRTQRIVVHVFSREGFGILQFESPSPTPTFGLDIESARAAVAAAGGRLLIVAEGGVVMQFQLYAPPDSVRSVPHRGTVLVAEDEPAVLAMMAAVLKREGYTALAVTNGVSATALLRTRGGDLAALITDAMLPGLSGVELVAEARRSFPHLPLLLVTGHDELVVSSKHTPVLRKPFGMRDFADRVRVLLSEPPA